MRSQAALPRSPHLCRRRLVTLQITESRQTEITFMGTRILVCFKTAPTQRALKKAHPGTWRFQLNSPFALGVQMKLWSKTNHFVGAQPCQ